MSNLIINPYSFGGAVPGGSVTYVNYSTKQNTVSSTMLTIAKPTGAVSGDILVAFASTDNFSESWTLPFGWTAIDNPAQRPAPLAAYRVLGAGEPASYLFVCNEPRLLGGSIVCFRGAKFDVGGTFPKAAVNPTAASVTLSAVGTVLAFFCTEENNSTVPYATDYTGIMQDDDESQPSWSISYKEGVSGAAGNQQITLADPGTGILVGIVPL